nr:Tn3 family transposase [Cupriavidus necator]
MAVSLLRGAQLVDVAGRPDRPPVSETDLLGAASENGEYCTTRASPLSTSSKWFRFSALLHRLVGTASAKNKLYFAFRELGRVVRTLFLLKYLNEPELRRTIHAATNKSEQFNDFAQWLMFGGDGTIAENVRHEQRKVIKYNHLVANMVILYNVQWMTRKLKDLQEKGHPVDAEVLRVLSPYRREHINRLGDYLLDLQRRATPLDPTIDFLFKSAA